MHASQAVLPSSHPVSRSEWQQYSTQRCIVGDFCVKGDQCVCFFVTALKVVRPSDHQIMIVVIVHHHACYTMFNSGNPNVRYDTVFSLGPVNINKSQFIAYICCTPFGVAGRGKASHEIACIGHSVIWGP